MVDAVLRQLKGLRRKADKTYYHPDLRKIAAQTGINHSLAEELWAEGSHPARHIAILIADPEKITSKFLEGWVRDLDSWDLCDGFTGRLVRYCKFAEKKAVEWADRNPEFEKRAGFALAAQMAWEKNDYPDQFFIDYLDLIEKHSVDDRYFVKKAVNWTLRDIGKRNPKLKKHALLLAKKLQKSDNKTARWVGTSEIKEIVNAHSRD